MGTLVISVHKKYDVVLFKGAVQLKLFTEKLQIVLHYGTI